MGNLPDRSKTTLPPPRRGAALQRRVAAVDDPLEREAERVAERVPAGPAGPTLAEPHASLPRATAQPVPEIVDHVLAEPGQALDSPARGEMERRFGRDFSFVRVHEGATAAHSARALNADAFTAGHHIVFGAGRLAPGTPAGRHLLAHELTHVVQQLSAGTSEGAWIARQPAGWSDAPKGTPNADANIVDAAGTVKAIKTGTKGVLRVPVDGLGHGLQSGDAGATHEKPGERAIVLIPNTVQAAAPDKEKNVKVDVLLHFHGFGIGYRQLRSGNKDFGGVLADNQVRDVELYQMEQQLLSHVATTKTLLIAVLPQGTTRSGFGDIGKNSGDYLSEVLGKIAPTFLPEHAVPGHVTVSGHSGGGVPAMAVANDRAKAGAQTDVLLFDAINFSCTDREPVDPDDSKKGTKCKEKSPCSSNEVVTVSNWVDARIADDLKGKDKTQDAELEADLKANGTRLRALTTGGLSDSDTCGYGHWYGVLDQHIASTIRAQKLGPAAAAQLHRNYEVRTAPGLSSFKGMEKHERMLGQGNLEATLKR